MATTAPFFPGHIRFGNRLQIVINRQLDRLARNGVLLSRSGPLRLPTLLTITRRIPSVPINVSLYCRSRPVFPTMSPGFSIVSGCFHLLGAHFADVADRVREHIRRGDSAGDGPSAFRAREYRRDAIR